MLMGCLPSKGAVVRSVAVGDFSEIDERLEQLLVGARVDDHKPAHVYYRPADRQFINIVGEAYRQLGECRYCGFEPEDQQRLPKAACPKCHRKQGWERTFVLHRQLRTRRAVGKENYGMSS